jgi:hypothetical protein
MTNALSVLLQMQSGFLQLESTLCHILTFFSKTLLRDKEKLSSYLKSASQKKLKNLIKTKTGFYKSNFAALCN